MNQTVLSSQSNRWPVRDIVQLALLLLSVKFDTYTESNKIDVLRFSGVIVKQRMRSYDSTRWVM